MAVIDLNQTLSTESISCGGSFQVRLSMTAAPDITEKPTDIVLILDRSGSMAGSPMTHMKNGAKAFIDLLDGATDGARNGQIGSGSRIAVVSFASTATQDAPLITSVSQLKAAVDGLSAGGSTNHADAFSKAAQLLEHSSNARVMVLFTDGETNAGPEPGLIAAAARESGTRIYAIGLSGNGDVDAAALKDWTSRPSSSYLSITPDETELETLFRGLAQDIASPGATNIVIQDTVSPCFRITSVAMPTTGSASLLDANSVQWQIPVLGGTQSEEASLEFTVQHIGPCSGTVEVNAAISYDDAEGNAPTVPSPTVEVDCGVILQPEACPAPVALTLDGCTDSMEFDAGTVALESLGSIVQLSVTLQNVCPNKRVALAAILTETDAQGQEYPRGMKTLLIPAHTQPFCQDVTVRCIRFVLPESLDTLTAPTPSACNARSLKVRFLANYVDSGFTCCEALS